jgi:predicted Zn-dependent protease
MLDAILNAARRAGAQQAEVFAVDTEETPVRFEANRPEWGVDPVA